MWSSDLQHHGILGQKWGIRRYQPYPKGHRGGREVGQAAERKYYISKESAGIDRKYDRKISRLQRRSSNISERIKSSDSEEKAARLRNKYAKVKTKEYYAKGMKIAEQKALNKFTLDDISSERRTVGMEIVKNLAIAGVLSVAFHTAGFPVAVAMYPNTGKVKTNFRVTAEEQARIRAQAEKQANKERATQKRR